MIGMWGQISLSLVLLLVYAYAFNGYIHPDEFFQSSEVISGNWFNIVHHRPWEFSAPSPCRSVFFPIVMFLMAGGFLTNPPTPLMYCLLMLAGSAKVLGHVSQVLKNLGKNTAALPLLLSPLWLTFFQRPFSNSVEAFLLACLFLRTLPRSHHTNLRKGKEIGAILALGFFNRPTFAFFACVPVLSWLYCGFVSTKSPRQRWYTAVADVIKSGLMVSLLQIILDSAYFGYYSWVWTCGEHARSSYSSALGFVVYKATGCSSHVPFRPVVTPFNWLRYNLQASNLAEHGLHPRITHIAVNMPLLFGVLAGLFYAFVLYALATRDLKHAVAVFIRPPAVITLRPQWGQHSPVNELTNSWQDSEWILVRRCACFLVGSIAVPLLLFSAAPHQEARFLLPLIIPLMVAFAQHLQSSRFLRCIAIIHMLAVLLFFGVLHQGGVTQGLMHQASRLAKRPYSNHVSSVEHHLIYYHTYMPPRSLLGWPQQYSEQLHVHDLGGAPISNLTSLVDSLYCASIGSSSQFHVWLMAPSSVPLPWWKRQRSHHYLNISIESSFGPHFSSEDPPGWPTTSYCAPTDSACIADTLSAHTHGITRSLINYYKYSLRLNLYQIDLLPSGVCNCRTSKTKACFNAVCPVRRFYSCQTPARWALPYVKQYFGHGYSLSSLY